MAPDAHDGARMFRAYVVDDVPARLTTHHLLPARPKPTVLCAALVAGAALLLAGGAAAPARARRARLGGAALRRRRPSRPRAGTRRSAPRRSRWVPGSEKSIRRARRWARARAGLVAFAVLDGRGRLGGLRRTLVFRSASVVKAMLLVAALRSARGRPLRADERALLEPMITLSDNDAALAMFARLGPDGLRRVARASGMRRFWVTGGAVRGEHHRGRSGAPLPAHRPARPAASPALRAPAAVVDRELAALGHPAGRTASRRQDVLQGRLAPGARAPGRARPARAPPDRDRGADQRLAVAGSTARRRSPGSQRACSADGVAVRQLTAIHTHCMYAATKETE